MRTMQGGALHLTYGTSRITLNGLGEEDLAQMSIEFL